MRINSNMVPDILADLQQSEQTLNTALQQVSTGLRVSVPSDDPTASAEMVQNTIESGEVDQYKQNVSSVLSTVQSASSVLNSVVNSLTQAVSIGTEGGNGTNNSSDFQSLAEQVQGILSEVVNAANTSIGGQYLFGGTSTATPFTENSSSSTGYTYNGNDETNSVEIGEGLSTQVNVPGSQIFTNSSNSVLGALSSLVSALQSGNTTQIQSATSSITSAVNYIAQQQVFYSNAESELNSQETSLQQDTVTLSTQANNLVGVDEAVAATNLSQAETYNSAAMAAAAKVLPNSLLNYLEPPS